MKEPPTATGEDGRLAALAEYDLLGTPNEEVFDALARVAAASCGTPFALVSLVDSDQLCFIANFGLPNVRNGPRDASFCSLAIQGTELLEITDAFSDMRVSKYPLVAGEPHLRFYAGVPLITESGHALGTLCVLDTKPRTLTPEQRAGLEAIAAT